MKKRKVKALLLTATALVAGIGIFGGYQRVFAHCQIPCGIYNDGARFTLLEEHVTTIEKSMKLIDELSASSPESNTNQIVRWVTNKEQHADELTEIVVKYFLQQRVKPASKNSGAQWEKYTKQLTLCHGLLVTSMKAKQTTDLVHVEKLRSLISEFKQSYLN